jgi:hypothetical protein
MGPNPIRKSTACFARRATGDRQGGIKRSTAELLRAAKNQRDVFGSLRNPPKRNLFDGPCRSSDRKSRKKDRAYEVRVSE